MPLTHDFIKNLFKSREIILDDHQVEAVQFIHDHSGQCCIFADTGTGKTLIGLAYAKSIEVRNLLIVCRPDDMMTWNDHLNMAYDPSERPQVDYVTYDGMRDPATIKMVQRTNYDLVIADELHSIKRWKSKRTKAVIKATRHIPRRVGMTATGMTNNVFEDVFTQCLFADNGRTFGQDYYKFLRQYYLQSGKGWYIRREARTQIPERLKRCALSICADDVLDLPRVNRVLKAYPMSPEQRRIHEQILKDWEYQIQAEGAPVEISQVIVQLSKLRQVAGGFIYQPDTGYPAFFKCGKLEGLYELVTSSDYFGDKPKIVIWAAHTAELHRIRKRLPGLSVIFYGGLNKADRIRARQAFRDDPAIRFFVGQVDAGVGMNELVGADTAIYYSNSQKVLSRTQSEGRIRRRGSERHQVITYVDLITIGSTDKKIRSTIQASVDLASEILVKLRQRESLREVLGVI